MKHNYKRITALAGMTALLVSMPVSVYAGQIRNTYTANLSNVLGSVDVSALKGNPVVKGSNIVVDSDTDDWDDITSRTADAAGVKLWKAAVSSDYSKLYFMYEGTVQTEWDYSYMGSNPVSITYADGTTGISDKIQFTGWKDSAQAKNSWYGDIENSETVTVNNAHGNTAGPYVVEAAIPFDFFADSDFKITFAGTTVDIKDIEVLDGRLSKQKRASYNNKDIAKECDLLERLKAFLEEGNLAKNFECQDEDEEAFLKEYNLLTAKPVIFAANVSEDDLANDGADNEYVERVREYSKKDNCEVFVICAQIEQEISELDDDEKKEFLEDLGLEESGLEKLISASYSLLGLISFLTSGEDETRAWTIKEGTKAPQAAGKIHTDFERGFICAEVVSFEDLKEYGTMQACKEKGLVRQEGKEYVVKDGDIIVFRFNV